MFSLLDQDGRILTRTTLEGTVWIADFIFTRCAGQCPLMSQQMATLQEAFAQMSQVRFVSFSVDPVYDTPAVLAGYAKRYGARSGRWDFLTGPASTIQQLAQEGFRLGVAEGASPREPITHSVRLVLVDQRGRIRGYYDAMDHDAVARPQRDTRRLSRGETS